MPTGFGETLDSTDLERTLIDIVVRPAYAGGLLNVMEVYKKVAHTVDIAHLTDLLRTLNYLYPYAQSIGFLLERAGRSANELKKLEGNFQARVSLCCRTDALSHGQDLPRVLRQLSIQT